MESLDSHQLLLQHVDGLERLKRLLRVGSHGRGDNGRGLCRSFSQVRELVGLQFPQVGVGVCSQNFQLHLPVILLCVRDRLLEGGEQVKGSHFIHHVLFDCLRQCLFIYVYLFIYVRCMQCACK